MPAQRESVVNHLQGKKFLCQQFLADSCSGYDLVAAIRDVSGEGGNVETSAEWIEFDSTN